MPSSNPKVHQQQFSTTESCFFFIEHWQLLQATKFGLKFTLVSFQFSTLALHTPPPQSAWEGGAQRSLHRNHHFRHHHHYRHPYLIFVIFFTRAKFLEDKIYTEKTRNLRQNTQKVANFFALLWQNTQKIANFSR